MFLWYVFALLCSTSICGMESESDVNKKVEDQVRREWQKKLYRPLNDFFDKKLPSKLVSRFDCLQTMLASEEHKEIKEQLAAETRDHYRKLANCLQNIDKKTANTIRSLFPGTIEMK